MPVSSVFARLTPYWLWLVLALPAFGMTWQIVTAQTPGIATDLLHPSGEFSARFLIIAMLASPLVLIFRGARFPRWLMRNRRYFGVAAFGYGGLHTLLYLIDRGSLERVLGQLPDLAIWTGWMAFAIFLPLAATSTDMAVKILGPAWKSLQRWTYVAAVLTLIHWAALHDWAHPAAAIAHFAPLAVLEGYRLWYWYLRPRQPRPVVG